jgi:CBS domain-containing protein
MKIEQIMSRDVVTIAPETPLRHAAAILSENRISGAPVCSSGGEVLGVLSEADILRKAEGVAPTYGRRLRWLLRRLDDETAKVEARTAGEAMTAPAITIGTSDPVASAARIMIDRRINRLPVVSSGVLVGIVTRADLVRAFHRSDEELAAEIRDEVLLRALWLSPAELSLSVQDGVVALSGAVDTEVDAAIAERLIRMVTGVVDVHTDLRPRVGRTDGRPSLVRGR